MPFRKLRPKGSTYSRPQLARKTARHISQEGPTHPKDQYDAIVDRLGAMADRDGRKSGAPRKVDQFNVCALRGFGAHKASISTGTYGAQMESCIRWQARSERDILWREKLKIPIANRIVKAASSGSFGNAASEGADEIAITIADCIAIDSTRYRAHRWDGEKIEPAGKEPHTTTCFANAVKKHIRLFSLLYGNEHARERKRALEKLMWPHDQKHELFAVSLLVISWNRIRYEYIDAIRGGVRAMIRLLPEGATRGSFVSFALSPYRDSGKRLWRRPNVFSLTASNGMWWGRISPEVGEQLGTSRILGSTRLRAAPPFGGAPSLSNDLKDTGNKKNKNDRTRTGGGSDVHVFTPSEVPRGAVNGNTYPMGKRLRAAEFYASKQHCHRDAGSGKKI